MNHLIIAPVLLPAIIAALILLLPRQARLLSIAGTAGLAALSLVLMSHTSRHPPETYLLGDWPAPYGIVLQLDRLSALMLVLVAVLAGAVLWQVIATRLDQKTRHSHTLFQFQLMGLSGAFLTADLFNLFVFFEVLLIASYGLMVHGGGAARLQAGLRYVAVNLVGSSLFLVALALIYAVTGTLNMADLAAKVAALPPGDHGLIRTAAVLLLLVFALKAALVPLHLWLPGTYANAPAPVAALFAVLTKVGAYAAIRTTTLIFPPETAATGRLLVDLMLPAALLTLLLGSLGALGAKGLPRQLAFATIASMGTLFIAVSTATPQATTAALYYLIHSTLAGGAMFLLADRLIPRPASAVVFFATAIAVAGLPPLSGFLGKLLILQATAAQALLVWPVILVGSFLLLTGFARAGAELFWAPDARTPPPHPTPIGPAAALLAALVALTAFAGPVTDWLALTAIALHGAP